MEEKAAVEDHVLAGGGGAAADADDLGEGMQCSEHPYRTNPGGICAFCLQEKLGSLLSAAGPSSFFTTTATATLANPSSSTTTSAAASAAADVLLLKASKSVAPRPLGDVAIVADSPRKKKHFWSFLYHSSSSYSSSSTATAAAKINQQQEEEEEEEEEPADAESSAGGSLPDSSSSFGRKVSRSRSVGCGSRSFSGDFLERISTGFGDCTLRRVESQRETRKRAAADGKMTTRSVRESRMKERVRCGGIFRGLGMSSASSYWLSSAEDKSSSRMSSKAASHRNRNWGWAFASPMRAFKPVSATSKSSRPASTVASINISSGKISNGNPPSSLAVGGR